MVIVYLPSQHPKKSAPKAMTTLMAVKVLGLIGLGAAFVWWQLRDLANEKKRAADSASERDKDTT